MIKIPYENIVEKIKEKTGLSAGEIEEKVNKKMELLSGLVSKEGAAHIIANEEGVKLFDDETGRLKIKNLLAGMKNVEVTGRVQDIFEVREFKTENRAGKVGSFSLGDETGITRIVLWGNQTDKLKELEKNMVVKIQFGYVKENQGRKEVHLRDTSNIILNPPDEVVNEVKKSEFTRKTIGELQENDNGIELLGSIVQIFEPKFFEICPQCGKRIKQAGSSPELRICEAHGEVKPGFSYVVNAFFDDGTGAIRATFFANQFQILSGKNNAELIEVRENPSKFGEIRNSILGKITKLVGRVNKNTMFDRMEFMVNRVYIPDPKEEIERLKANLGIKAEANETTESKIEKNKEHDASSSDLDAVTDVETF